MADILDAQSYQFQWLSLPYFLAMLGLAAMGVYTLVMSGAPLLRGAFLVICAGLIPVTAAYALAGSTTDPLVAAALYKFGLALVPTAAAGVFAFEAALTQQVEQHGRLVFIALASSLAQSVPVLTTDWYVAGIWQTSWGLYHFEAGALAPLHLASIALWGGMSGLLVRSSLRTEQSPLRRRQIRGSMLAFSTVALSAVDALLAYGVDIYPTSWLFLSAGTLLLFRSLTSHDLIYSRAIDWRAPLVLLYTVAAGAGIWLVWYLSGDAPVGLVALRCVAVFVGLRLSIALIQLIRQPHPGLSDSPLERVVNQYAARMQSIHSEAEIARITADSVSLGLGCKDAALIMPSANDWSWETVDGEVLSEQATPDPLTSGWLMEHAQPLQRIDLPTLPLEDFLEPVTALFDANRAEIIVPLINRDEMVGMLILSGFPGQRVLSRGEVRFLEKIQEHLTSALLYARMHREADARAVVKKEVDLAATIQNAFVSSADLVDCGTVQVSGLWAPATQCGGDWWSVHQLPDGRVLVLIGDVTGHGVAAAMVTAAAKGCYDVVQRLMGEQLDLVELLAHLDSTVRMVGADRFHMTCFATLLDPDHGTVTYANAGHVAPYVCRPGQDGGVELGSLVARGNPLGAGDEPCYRAHVRDLASGDILVWYTDGIVECTDSQENQFGERRMQRLLRKIDGLDPDARSVRDHIARAVAAFQSGHPPDDDITLVVGRVM